MARPSRKRQLLSSELAHSRAQMNGRVATCLLLRVPSSSNLRGVPRVPWAPFGEGTCVPGRPGTDGDNSLKCPPPLGHLGARAPSGAPGRGRRGQLPVLVAGLPLGLGWAQAAGGPGGSWTLRSEQWALRVCWWRRLSLISLVMSAGSRTPWGPKSKDTQVLYTDSL